MRLEAQLRESARRFGDKTALVAGDVRLTYAEVDTLSDHLAASLKHRGLASGDRILLVLDNGQESVIGFFGAWKAGSVACPLHPSIKAEKLAAIMQSTGATAVIVQARLLKMLQAALQIAKASPLVILAQAHAALEPGSMLSFKEAVAQQAPVLLGHHQEDSDALALLIHTSGSTGVPKGVMLSHASVTAACEAITTYLGNTASDVVLSVLPLSFGYGITQMVTMAIAGGTLVLEKSFAFPRKILERLQEEKATGFPLVPAMAALLTGMKDLQPGLLPHLRYITSAAAAMPPTLSQGLQQLFPAARLFLMYGQTECLRATYLAPEEASRRPLSVGKAIPGSRAFVVDEEGRVLAPGQIGELVIEGPHVMSGYWGDSLASVRSLAPGGAGRRLHTGDLFRTDEDGFLYFVSRRDDIIKTRGEKVSPQEVEHALYALAGIREAAVGGVDDPIFGQTIRAYVALEDGAALSERDIIRHCAGMLEDYMVPKSVEFRDRLPRTTTGKIRLGADEPEPIMKGSVA
jgi:acyl-CoA synthetase (AMP-forming)/AMP-acid ligase II